jgi:site-specific recombinase XerC
MAYQWTSNAAQTVTTDPTIDVSPHRRPEATVAAAIEQFVAAAQIGAAVNRSGRPYRPSALRDIRGILEYHIAPDLGRMRLRDVRRSDVQMLVERLAAEGLSESRIRSVISALRALYGYAIDRGYVEFNPADGLVMPPTGARRAPRREPVRVATPAMVDTVTERDPPRPREPRERERAAAAPGSGLPDRVLSLALRAALVLFALVVLVSLLAPI